MSVFEFTNDEFHNLVVVTELGRGLVASTEFDFIKYVSDPVEFNFEKYKKIHSRIKYEMTFERTYIQLVYEDPDFDFKLCFTMKKEDIDIHKETLIKIKKAATELAQLKKEVATIQKNMHFGLEVVNERIKFYATQKGIRMEGDPELVARFSELMKYMAGTVYPDYNPARSGLWSDEWDTLEEVLKSAYNLYYHSGGVRTYFNILNDIKYFCISVPSGIFVWRDHEPGWSSSQTEHTYEELSKKNDVLVAEVAILYFPEYEVFESREERNDLSKTEKLFEGNILHGFVAWQEAYVSESRHILWNYFY